jgi:hypothetical protein
MRLSLILTGVILCMDLQLKSQENYSSQTFEANGYLTGMPSLYWNEDSSLWQVLIHNRLNFNWYPSEYLTASIQLRNQIIAGDFAELMHAKEGFVKENYFLPLTFHRYLDHRYLLSSAIDRFWLQYTWNKLEIKIGRQRINWSQTFVWNPNDIFNTYNFFDFDYPERPGADAIRLQYYTGNTSSLDLAVKIDSSKNITGASLFRFTRWNTEFQLLAGYLSNMNQVQISDTFPAYTWKTEDLVCGSGFSAGFGTVSLRGEFSYLYSVQENNDSTNQFLASITVDYTLGSKTSMMFEFFFNNNVLLSDISFFGLYGASQNIKTLAFTKYNAFGQVTYPIIPILNGTLASMYFFDKNLMGIFIGPSIDLSLGNDLTLSTFFQIFTFRYENPFTSEKEWLNSNFAFLRLKWNF